MNLKRIAGLLAALVFAFAVVACNNDDDATPEPAGETPAAEVTEAPAE